MIRDNVDAIGSKSPNAPSSSTVTPPEVAGVAGGVEVGTDVGGVSEIIINGKTGFVVEKGNYEEYIDKISILINNEEKRKQMGIDEYEYVKNNFTWKEVVKEFVSEINKKK